jgi:uncharacterized protein (TIGR02996 family)
MNQADLLLAAVLEEPDDPARWLVLSDWLEEQGGADSLARAGLLRLRTEWSNAGSPARREKAEKRAAAVLKKQPTLIGDLHPLLAHGLRVLTQPKALALFVLADYASVVVGPLAAGTTWEGKLKQGPYAFPTTLQLRKRDGNRFEGDMRQDFRTMYRSAVDGVFHFRGVAIGEHVAFVTWKMEGAAAGPGLYQFQVSRRNRWDGTWGVGDCTWNGTMRLQPHPPPSDD